MAEIVGSYSAKEEENFVKALEAPAPEAKQVVDVLKANGISFFQIVALLMQYGPMLFEYVTKGGQWLKDVIDAIRNNKPLPPFPG